MQRLFSGILAAAGIYFCCALLTVDNPPLTLTSISTPLSVQSSTAKDTRTILVQEAKKLLGKKYKYGGTTPKGFDCSGFTSFVYNKADVVLPRSSSAQAQKGKKITPGAAKPGDLLFFKFSKKGKIAHVAMVLSNNRYGLEIIHSTTSKGVLIEKINNSKYWGEKLLYGRNYID